MSKHSEYGDRLAAEVVALRAEADAARKLGEPYGNGDAANPKDLLGIKKCRLDLVPPALRILAAPAMLLGAKKYGSFNWRKKSVKLTVYTGAIDRHMAAFEDGQTNDPESGASHLSHVAACLAIIADAQAIGRLIDDRPVPGGAAELMEAQNE